MGYDSNVSQSILRTVLAAGSFWPADNFRYFQAEHTPGTREPCSSEILEPWLYQSVFPSGTKKFCRLKSGYPGVEATDEEIVNTTTNLCELFRAGPTWRESLGSSWEKYCSEGEMLHERWPHTLVVFHKLVGLKLKGLGLQGTIPKQLFALQNLVELDLSRNFLTGMLPALALLCG